jgi:hypothetical protein
MDVADHALICGMDTASPRVHLGDARSYCAHPHGRPQSVRREFPVVVLLHPCAAPWQASGRGSIGIEDVTDALPEVPAALS